MISQQNPVYTTSIAEKLDVFLLVTSNYGCVDSARNYPEIFPIPEASFTEEIGCQEKETSFEDQSTVSKGLVDQWVWSFGDGGTSSVADPIHTYMLPGNYDVQLIITSNKNCVHETTKQIFVPDIPRVDFEVIPETGCTPLRAQAVNLSTIGSGSLQYTWWLDDKLVSNEVSPVIRVINDTLAPKPYTLRAQARSDYGCTASKTKDDVVWVFPAPKARFNFDRASIDIFEDDIAFENLSEHSIAWQWSFGDGGSSQDFAPVYLFDQSGTYEVELVAFNEYQCTDTVKHLVEVDPKTTIYIPSAFSPNGDGDNDVWDISGITQGGDFKVRVFDRWGHLMFESSDFDFQWDGKISDGKLAPAGVYVYDIGLELPDGDVATANGQFTLLR